MDGKRLRNRTGKRQISVRYHSLTCNTAALSKGHTEGKKLKNDTETLHQNSLSPIYWFDITAQMKTVIDRLYAGGSVGFHFHKTALLLDAGADHVFDAAIAQYKAMTSYLKWEDMGIITVPNMETKGSMTTAPNLAAVIRLGESL